MKKIIKGLQFAIGALAVIGLFGNGYDAHAASLANQSVEVFATQPDGKIVMGGNFTMYNGSLAYRITRINASGTRDGSFSSGSGANSMVRAMDIQSDGKIIIGGDFTTYSGTSVGRIARLNANGSIDNTFNYSAGGADNTIYSVSVQPDGKIIITGDFTTYKGVSKNRIARLNSDGTADASFNLGTGANASVRSTATQSDGSIIIGGVFTNYNGTAKNYIARLNSNGTIDNTFNSGTGASSYVYTVAIQPDDTIVIGGDFTAYNSISKYRIAKLNYDGSLVTTFNSAAGANDYIWKTATQSDGKIVIVGWFTTYDGVSRSHVARINSNGSLDATFNPGVGTASYVRAISSQTDGKIIVGGAFTTFNSLARGYMTRLNTDGSNDVTLGNATVATISTQAVTDISQTHAMGNGNISDAGGEDSERYIDWGTTSGNYTNFCSAGTGGVGDYYCTMSNLAPGTTYYVRARANNSAGSAYGGEVTFQTASILLPTVLTNPTVYRDGKSATGSGYISDTGGEYPVGAIEWGVQSGVYTNSCSIGSVDVGNFSCIISGLSVNNTYYIRAKATNSAGTAYGSETTFYNPLILASGPILATAVQSDNKIIIVGNFTAYKGVAASHIARLNANGTIDTSFDSGDGLDDSANGVAIQSDGKIIVVGRGFTSYDGVARNNIVRINADGSLDETFGTGVGAGAQVGNPTTNNFIETVAVQTDGKIIVGGQFYNYDGVSRLKIARLNSDGSLDAGFVPDSSLDGYVSDIAIQSDGKIVIGGGSSSGNSSNRLNSDGSRDAMVRDCFISSTNYYNDAVAVQSDGKIIVGGWFSNNGDASMNSISRFTNMYSSCSYAESGFNSNVGTGASIPYAGGIKKIVIQSDGKIIIGGGFTSFNGSSMSHIARLNTAGTLDTNFNIGAGANNNVNAISVQSDGKIIVSGSFTLFDGVTNEYIARLNPDGSLDTAFGNAPSVVSPTLTTSSTTSITQTTATGNANLTDTGGEDPQRIIEWGAATNTYANSCSAGIGSTGTYSCNLTDLTPDTTYYIRASATNSQGTSHGEETSFHTLPLKVTIIDPTPTKMNQALTSNYLALESGASTATPKTTTNVGVIFQTGMASLELPINTEITNKNSGNFNLENFVTIDRTALVQQIFPGARAAVKVGVPDTKLSFSQPVTLSINVDPAYNDAVMNVFYQNDGETDWHSQASCTITEGKCSFTTNHATTYTVNTDGTMVGETGINLNTDVQEVIALDCGATSINLGNITPGTPITGSSTCTATTNANGGYNLSVRRDDATSTLKKNSENSITISDLTPWDPTTPNANTWSGNGLGFTVYNSTANKNSAWWGTGTTLTDSNNKYAGFNTTQSDIMRNSTYAATSTATDIGYMLNVPPTQKSGAYSGSVTYQAVTTP